MAVSPYAKTLRQVINNTLRYCNDYRGDGRDGQAWTWNEVADRAKLLILNLVRETGMLRDSAQVTLQDGVTVYDLPPDCIRPLRFQIHGLEGAIVLNRSISELDMVGQPLAVDGDPYYFMRDLLAPDQVAFFPRPYRNGSAFTRDSQYGLLRQIQDADGNNLPFDANQPLRRIAGVPFIRRGDGGIIRDVVASGGNILVTYVRAPEQWTKPDDYPDPDIPEWLHKELKYGIAEMLLPVSRNKVHAAKLARARVKWRRAKDNLMRRVEYQGPAGGMRPV